MSATLRQIQRLAENGDVRISLHGYEELVEDDVSVRDLLQGIEAAVLVEDYPEYPKGHVAWFCSKMDSASPFM